MIRRIALVTQELSFGGGCATMTAFLYRVLRESGRYKPDIVSLAASSSDDVSVRLRAPWTWRKGVQSQSAEWRGLPHVRVGAMWSELEFQRYRPRPLLSRLLAGYDACQFVVGAPGLACVAAELERPILIWTATTIWAERASLLRSAPLARRVWSLAMTRLTQRFERRALREVDFVFALSHYTLAAVQRVARPACTALASCGVDTDLFSPAGSPDRGYILCVARFSDARKNVALLLRAYAELLRDTMERPDLYLVGEPPSAGVQSLLRRLQIADRVHLVGVKQGAELADLYRHAQFFALASDEEGLGIVVLEAMASGLPVVSTRCGGPETAVVDGETGFLTPVADAQALADAMRRLLEDPGLRRRMGQSGRRLAEERFSLDVTGNVFLRKYDELLGTSAS